MKLQVRRLTIFIFLPCFFQHLLVNKTHDGEKIVTKLFLGVLVILVNKFLTNNFRESFS